MNRTHTARLLAIACLAGAGASAMGQSASIELVPAAGSAAPGDSVLVDIVVTFDSAGAAPGVFGSSGLYGFGGDVVLSAGDADDASASSPAVSALLTFGQTASVGSGAMLAQAAGGRGFDGGLTSSPQSVGSFSLDISSGAADGAALSVGFDGAVVLAIGDQLRTFSTNPGPNQNPLSVTTGSIMVTGGASCIADLTTTGATLFGQPGFGVPDGVADGDDLSFFLNIWVTGDLAADFTTTGATLAGQSGFGVPDGSVDGDDLSFFLNFWLRGCN